MSKARVSSAAAECSATDDGFASDMEQFSSVLPEVMQYRGYAIGLFRFLESSLNAGAPLNPDDLRDLKELTLNRARFEQLLSGLAQKYRPLLSHYDDKITELNPCLYQRASLVLAAMITIDDTLLMSSLLYEDNDRLRRLLNERFEQYGIHKNELSKAIAKYNSRANRRLKLKALEIHEAGARLTKDAAYAVDSLLESVITNTSLDDSKALNEDITPYATTDDLLKNRAVKANRVEDFFTNLGNAFVYTVSKEFGYSLGSFQWRQGKLYRNEAITKVVHDTLQPLDILFERTRYRVAGRLIPGFFGHNAVWIGTEDQLRKLGLWDHPIVTPYQEAIRNGRSIVEALRFGVVMNPVENFLNIDDLAVARKRNLSEQEQREGILTALSQVGKPYDFLFDTDDDSKMTCAEIPFTVYHNIDFIRSRTFGRWTVTPDNVAMTLLNLGSGFEFKLLYFNGTRITDDLDNQLREIVSHHTLVRRAMKNSVLLSALLLLSAATASALDELPEQVFIKSTEQGFAYENNYALKDGKLWIKPNQSTTGI
jgi:hypothetical protein